MKENTHRPTERVLNILELLTANPEGLTLTGIADAIKAPKSSIFPVIHTMSDRRFIFLDKATLKYTIGIASFCVGTSYSSNKGVLDFINDEMKYIVSKINETCQMGILDGRNVLYVSKIEPDDKDMDIRLVSHVGKRLPIYCTALGKALICEHDIEEIKAYYPEGLKAYTRNTITSFEDLEKQLHQIRVSHIATESEEITDHLRCFAVPLSADKKIIAALSVSIPAFRVTEDKIDVLTHALLNAKEKIETYFYTVNVDTDSFIFKK